MASLIRLGLVTADVMKGFGWEDICAKHKITNHIDRHRIRGLVLSYGKEKAKPFYRSEWEASSGYSPKPADIWRRAVRPIKKQKAGST